MEIWYRTIDPLDAGGWKLATLNNWPKGGLIYASTHNVIRAGSIVTMWFRWGVLKASE